MNIVPQREGKAKQVSPSCDTRLEQLVRGAADLCSQYHGDYTVLARGLLTSSEDQTQRQH